MIGESDSETNGGGKPGEPSAPADERRRKLSEALRRNLRRRKDAGRTRDDHEQAGDTAQKPSTGSP